MRSRWPMALFMVGSFVLFFGLSVLAWGDWRGFVAHPARRGVLIVSLLATFAALFTDVNMSSGRREDVGNRWVLLPALIGNLVLCVLPPYLDRRELWTVDGDGMRCLGLGLTVVGAVLRLWPMFTLGRRFSGLVAIQPGHELMTGGIYRCVRNPSYLGVLLFMVGWGFVFRSVLGLALVVLGLPLLLDRIAAEEHLLRSEFGDAYVAYCARTWRLVPWVY